MKAVKAVLLLMAVMASQAAEPAQFGYFELRVYTVTSNKMDGVLERFRETVEPVRRKHGVHFVRRDGINAEFKIPELRWHRGLRGHHRH